MRIVPPEGPNVTTGHRDEASRNRANEASILVAAPGQLGIEAGAMRPVPVSTPGGRQHGAVRTGRLTRSGAAGADEAGAGPSARGRARAVRSAWVDFLQPHFPNDSSTYVTLTYSDEYGYPHGCMRPYNALKDARRCFRDLGYTGQWFLAVEAHRDRSIMHMHGILDGGISRDLLKAAWQHERGWAKVLPVRDGCHSYVVKYLLKDADGDCIDFAIGG